MSELALLFLQLGGLIFGLAVVARLASLVGFSPIPFYLLFGLTVSILDLVPHGLTYEFIHIGGELGVILLLFMLGLEYSGEELSYILKTGVKSGLADVALNFIPGVLFGLLLGWGYVAAILLGGVTYISSSGVIAKVLNDLDRLGNLETPTILSLLVFEDLVMAIYLPIVVVLTVGATLMGALTGLLAALITVTIVLFCALRFGTQISNVISHQSGEVVLLTTLGGVLLIAGIAQQMQVSSAVGAFLVGIGLSGPVAEHARGLVTPLRDLFAATFFLYFGLSIDPTTIPPVLLIALLLAFITGATKILTGWWAAKQSGIASNGRWRAGVSLTSRGEFSIVIAGLGGAAGAAIEPQLAPLAAAYVLILALSGPILTRFIDPIVDYFKKFKNREAASPST